MHLIFLQVSQQQRGIDNQRDIRSSFAASQSSRKKRKTRDYYEKGFIDISDSSDDNSEFKSEHSKSKKRKASGTSTGKKATRGLAAIEERTQTICSSVSGDSSCSRKGFDKDKDSKESDNRKGYAFGETSLVAPESTIVDGILQQPLSENCRDVKMAEFGEVVDTKSERESVSVVFKDPDSIEGASISVLAQANDSVVKLATSKSPEEELPLRETCADAVGLEAAGQSDLGWKFYRHVVAKIYFEELK